MDIDMPDHAAFEARLDQTVKALEDRVARQRAALDKQLHVIKAAYDRLTAAELSLPARDSALPSLLATRNIQQTVSGTKAAIEADQEKLRLTQQDLQREQANLNDAKALTTALERRIERLRAQQREKDQRDPSQAARNLLREKQKTKQRYDQEAKNLRNALNDFVNHHLASMLAAEDLGGPVVGDLIDLDDDLLAAGFTHQGKPRARAKVKESLQEANRQRRIDEFCERADQGGEGGSASEKDAAAQEVQQLIDDLFGALLGEAGSGVYVELDGDSAAARFLVRAKVAQFHPKDARRLRLVDFGRELDD
ncbi:hypothetical protein H2199_002037 [Coniosporium tulheliwenetii]|uniref:Uncharacterized protein n=1 Tax=Coniosporium tulheliwenetii TaxID=3383036 RepID=A0ACC2ZGZ1_9PEZI|nr:hypothetical protein H2199_002037 [Cladosporium sp. JES 115]